jgi:addiction module HigA family antidote
VGPIDELSRDGNLENAPGFRFAPSGLRHYSFFVPKKLKPMHPGEVLREEFLSPLDMSAGALAKTCGLPRTRIERIASEQTGITADTALRLAKALGTTAELWLNLQNDYDIQIAKRDLGKALDRIETVNKPRAA